MRIRAAYILAFIFISSCSPKPEDIRYGEDACSFCQMGIVDKKFGCELVTDKSKIYKFDAVECLVNFINQEGFSSENMPYLLINTLDKPGQLLPVDQCLFIHSRKMPSPMGMFLNPVHNHDMAKEISKRNDGEILTWDELPDLVLNRKSI